jgi:hypothetical protein
MLARYQIVRGKRDPSNPLPDGQRLDVRKHTHHVLSPNAGSVLAYLEDPSDEHFERFAAEYEMLLEKRFAAERPRFDALASAAREGDVYVGCSCPTRKNPNVKHCHTVLALRFMRAKYPRLKVVLPAPAR